MKKNILLLVLFQITNIIAMEQAEYATEPSAITVLEPLPKRTKREVEAAESLLFLAPTITAEQQNQLQPHVINYQMKTINPEVHNGSIYSIGLSSNKRYLTIFENLPGQQILVNGFYFDLIEKKHKKFPDKLLAANSREKMILNCTGDYILYTSQQGGVIYKWIIGEQEPQKIIKVNKDIKNIAESCDGAIIAALGSTNTLFLYTTRAQNLTQHSFIPATDFYSSYIRSVIISPANKYLVCSYHRGVLVFDLITGKPILTKTMDQEKTAPIAMSHNDNNLIIGWESGTLEIHNISQNISKNIRAHNQPIAAIAVSHDNRFIFSASYDGTIKIWNFDGNLLDTLTLPNHDSATALFITNDGTIVAGSKNSFVYIFDPRRQQINY